MEAYCVKSLYVLMFGCFATVFVDGWRYKEGVTHDKGLTVIRSKAPYPDSHKNAWSAFSRKSPGDRYMGPDRYENVDPTNWHNDRVKRSRSGDWDRYRTYGYENPEHMDDFYRAEYLHDKKTFSDREKLRAYGYVLPPEYVGDSPDKAEKLKPRTEYDNDGKTSPGYKASVTPPETPETEDIKSYNAQSGQRAARPKKARIMKMKTETIIVHSGNKTEEGDNDLERNTLHEAKSADSEKSVNDRVNLENSEGEEVYQHVEGVLDEEKQAFPVQKPNDESFEHLSRKKRTADAKQGDLLKENRLNDANLEPLSREKRLDDKNDQIPLSREKRLDDIDHRPLSREKRLDDQDEKTLSREKRLDDQDEKTLSREKRLDDQDDKTLSREKRLDDQDEKPLSREKRLDDQDEKPLSREKRLDDQEEKTLSREKRLDDQQSPLSREKRFDRKTDIELPEETQTNHEYYKVLSREKRLDGEENSHIRITDEEQEMNFRTFVFQGEPKIYAGEPLKSKDHIPNFAKEHIERLKKKNDAMIRLNGEILEGIKSDANTDTGMKYKTKMKPKHIGKKEQRPDPDKLADE